jgi:hypothetical protein
MYNIINYTTANHRKGNKTGEKPAQINHRGHRAHGGGAEQEIVATTTPHPKLRTLSTLDLPSNFATSVKKLRTPPEPTFTKTIKAKPSKDATWPESTDGQ